MATRGPKITCHCGCCRKCLNRGWTRNSRKRKKARDAAFPDEPSDQELDRRALEDLNRNDYSQE